MFDAVLDVLFPLVLLGIPMVALAGLAGFVFGKAETIAALKVVGVVALKMLLNVSRRVHRAALAFVSDDAIPALGNARTRKMSLSDVGELMQEIDRLDDRINRRTEELGDLYNRLGALEERLDMTEEYDNTLGSSSSAS